MLETVRIRLPSIYPLLWQAYCSDSPLDIGDSKIWSRTGIQQGDPLSSLLFSLAINSVSKGITTDINIWYLDDATIGGPVEEVTKNIQRIKSQLGEKGLQINSRKSVAVRCGATVDSRSLHALSCQLSAGRLPRHAALNDTVKRALLSAGMPSILEPAGLDHGDGRRPDGMTTFPFSSGRCLIWDSTCVDTYADYVIHKSATQAGSAAQAAEKRK